MSCPLCLTPLVGVGVKIPCGEVICNDCIDSLLLGGTSFECPFCMEEHPFDDSNEKDEMSLPSNDYVEESSKNDLNNVENDSGNVENDMNISLNKQSSLDIQDKSDNDFHVEIDNVKESTIITTTTETPEYEDEHELKKQEDNEQPKQSVEEPVDVSEKNHEQLDMKNKEDSTPFNQSTSIIDVQDTMINNEFGFNTTTSGIPLPQTISSQQSNTYPDLNKTDVQFSYSPPPYSPPPPEKELNQQNQPFTDVSTYNINASYIKPTLPPKQKKPPPPPVKPKPNLKSTNPFDSTSPLSSQSNTYNQYPQFGDDEIPPQFAAAYGPPPTKPVPPPKPVLYETSSFVAPSKPQPPTPQQKQQIFTPQTHETFQQPQRTTYQTEYKPQPQPQQRSSTASGVVICSSENFDCPKLPLHFLRQELDSEKLHKIFSKWVTSGIFTPKKLIEEYNSQPVLFDDIHMIPFLWISLVFSCDGCVGYYERPTSSVVCLWKSNSPYRHLLNTEIPIPQGKLYKFDPNDPSAKTLDEIDNPSIMNRLSGWFKNDEGNITKDIPRVMFEDSKDPMNCLNDFVKGEMGLLTTEYKSTALKSSSADYKRSCSVKIVEEKSKVTRIYVPYCFTGYTYEGKRLPILINSINGEVYGSKPKKALGFSWGSK
ncbi:Zinc finger domain containing protein [Entamoeba marina]